MTQELKALLADVRTRLQRAPLHDDEAADLIDRINGALGCEPGCECER